MAMDNERALESARGSINEPSGHLCVVVNEVVAEPHIKHAKKKKDKVSDSDSDSDDESNKLVNKSKKKRDKDLKKKESGQLPFADKQSNQWIPTEYSDLVSWLQKRLASSHDAAYLQEWQALFEGQLQRHTILRTRLAFGELVDEYKKLDPLPLARIDPDAATKDAGDPRSLKFASGALHKLLAACGFQRMPKEHIAEANKKVGRFGLDVRVPDVDELDVRVYYRGMFTKTVTSRSWKTCFQARSEEDLHYHEMVMVYRYLLTKEDDAPAGKYDRLKWAARNKAARRVVGPAGSEGKLFVRAYHDIPVWDTDMLWPGAVPNPSIKDALFVLVPFLGALGVAIYKLYTLMADTNSLSNTSNLMVIIFAIIAPFTVSIKAFSKAKGKYAKYKAHQAEVVVNQTMAVNRGALAQLIEGAAEQDNKEFCLAYTALAESDRALTRGDLLATCNGMLRELDPATTVDFDVDDALRKLRRAGMVSQDQQTGAYSVLDLEGARDRLALSQFD